MKEWIFRKVFSEWIPFKWIDGHKTEIARLFTFLSGLLLLLQKTLPQYAGVLMDVNAQLMALIGLLGIQIAQAHREIKSGAK